MSLLPVMARAHRAWAARNAPWLLLGPGEPDPLPAAPEPVLRPVVKPDSPFRPPSGSSQRG